MIIDSHCHLYETNYKTSLKCWELSKIDKVISTVLSQKQLYWHKSNLSQKVILSAGIHPFYYAENPFNIDELSQLLFTKEIKIIGEIGLDSRNSNFEEQKIILLSQLELARDFDVPVIFHCVKKYYELHKILKSNFPHIRGFFHGFHSSLEVVNLFDDMQIGFSIGRIFPKESAMHKIAKKALIFIESDAPFCFPTTSITSESYLKILDDIYKKIQTVIPEIPLSNLLEKSFFRIFSE